MPLMVNAARLRYAAIGTHRQSVAIWPQAGVKSDDGVLFRKTRAPRPARDPSRAAGFSLMEMIAALAIISAASLALFQSIAFWLRLSTAATGAAASAVSESIDLERFQRLVRGLSYAWPEQPDDIFTGGPAGFRGLTRYPLHFADPGLERVVLSVAEQDGAFSLAYAADGVAWTVAAAGAGGSLRFSYLGIDGVWRQSWPPDATPMATADDDPALFRTPQLPVAIRLDYEGQPSFSWIADVGDDPTPAGRTQDIIGVSDDAGP